MATKTTQFKKGQDPWNKGKVGVQPSTRKGKRLPPLPDEVKKKISQSISKDKHWNWKGGSMNFQTHLQMYRANVLEILGLKCCKCGFEDIRALQIDHVNGGGHKERSNFSGRSYYKLILGKVLQGSREYQILCANCNWIKRSELKENTTL